MDSVVSIRVGQSQGNHVTLCEEAPFDTGSLATMRVLEPPSEGWMEDEAVGIVGCALSCQSMGDVMTNIDELLTPRDGLSVEITRVNKGWAGRCWIYETLVGFNSRRVGTWLLGTISVALLFCMCICTVWDGGVGPVVGRIGGDRSQSTCASMCGGRFQHGVASS
ncbi:hypothetical protein V6N11_008653 [Hibiscus sabdariffa]|uniref:Uncharacterized protein n=2 Tax=Hibiscus sabdariffa TaxID=183260 RepID=A0ABR2A376_9ROSI